MTLNFEAEVNVPFDFVSLRLPLALLNRGRK